MTAEDRELLEECLQILEKVSFSGHDWWCPTRDDSSRQCACKINPIIRKLEQRLHGVKNSIDKPQD